MYLEKWMDHSVWKYLRRHYFRIIWSDLEQIWHDAKLCGRGYAKAELILEKAERA